MVRYQLPGGKHRNKRKETSQGKNGGKFKKQNSIAMKYLIYTTACLVVIQRRKDRVNFVGGNYLFTAEEIDYFKRLARCLIERDLKVTNTAIMKRLHAKVGSLCYIGIISLLFFSKSFEKYIIHEKCKFD